MKTGLKIGLLTRLGMVSALTVGLMSAGAAADEDGNAGGWVGALGACADCWMLSAGAVALDRGIDDDRTVIAVEPGTFDGIGPITFGAIGDDIAIVKTDRDLSFGTEVGGTFRAGRAFGRKWSVEVSGLHVSHDDEIAVGGVPGNTPGQNGNALANRISLPFDDSDSNVPNSFLHGVSGADSARAAYESDLYDLQLNGRHAFNNWFSLLFGLRYTQLSEQFHLSATDGVGQPEAQTQYDVHANNHMIGPQLGVAVGTPQLWNHLSFGFTGKVAPMLNLANQNQTLSENATSPLNFLSTNGGFVRENRDSKADFSYLSELGADVTIHVNDWVQFNFGYMAMFLGGVASAPDNFDFSTQTPEGVEDISTASNVFYRGGTGMARVTFKLP